MYSASSDAGVRNDGYGYKLYVEVGTDFLSYVEPTFRNHVYHSIQIV